MIKTVVTGGQTGVDQAAWRAAKRVGLATMGWMPLGFRTEECDRPEFRDEFDAEESRSPVYDVRTSLNVALSHIVLWIGPGCDQSRSPGFLCTQKFAKKFQRRLLIDADFGSDPPAHVIHTLMHPDYETVMIAGTRESRCPGAGYLAEQYLFHAFDLAVTQHREALVKRDAFRAERKGGARTTPGGG